MTPHSSVRLDAFGDKQFVGAKISSLKPFRWLPARVYREIPNSEGVSVVSLVKISNLSDRSLLVVNVATDSLSAIIGKMSESKLNFAELVDDSGNVHGSRQRKPCHGTAGIVGRFNCVRSNRITNILWLTEFGRGFYNCKYQISNERG